MMRSAESANTATMTLMDAAAATGGASTERLVLTSGGAIEDDWTPSDDEAHRRLVTGSYNIRRTSHAAS